MFNTHEFDWSQIQGNPILVFDCLYVSRQAAHRWPARADGLFEMCFLRLKKRREIWVDGTVNEWSVPIFSLPSDRKQQTDRTGSVFAFADDPEGVAALVAHVAVERAKEEERQRDWEARRLEEKARRQAKYQALREAHESELREKAASIGVSLEELMEVMKAWDGLRAHSYRQNHCGMCGRALIDPASIVRGIGPECIQQIPALKAALQAKVIDIGKLRYNAKALAQRLTRAGFEDMAAIILQNVAIESGDRNGRA